MYGQFTELRNSDAANGAGLGWGDVAVQVGRGVIDRFDKARAGFYGRCERRKAGENVPAGYRRFKSRRRWRTIQIPDPSPSMVQPPADAAGRWWKLKVKGLGVVKFVPYDCDRVLRELDAGGGRVG